MANLETQILLSLNEMEFSTSEQLTLDLIKQRYRHLSLKFHSDLNGDEVFERKQYKLNDAKEFLSNNLDVVNRYIRKINHMETDEDRRADEEQQRREQKREDYERQRQEENRRRQEEYDRQRAYEEAQQRAQEEAARRSQEEAARRAEEESRRRAEERRQREAADRARRAEEERRREQEELRRRLEEEELRRQAEERRKKEKMWKIVGIVLGSLMAIPMLVGLFISIFGGMFEEENPGYTFDIQSTNLPAYFVMNQDVDWEDYYVVYKDLDGKEHTVELTAGMISLDLTEAGEKELHITIKGEKDIHLYHKLTVKECTMIDSAEDLKKITNNPSGLFMLDADIDLSGEEWTPISHFSGSLFGKGHTIRNLSITKMSAKEIGLFGTIAEGAYVDALTLENAEIVSFGSADCVGLLAGRCGGTVKDIEVSGKVDVSGISSVGGVVGTFSGAKGTLESVSFDGTVIGGDGVGGIAGGKDDGFDVVLTDCTASGSVSGNTHVGGILGYMTSSNGKTVTIENCTNKASVTAKMDYCGGIAGKLHCGNNWGGPTFSITGCQNEGAITGKSYTAGIVGSLNVDGTLTFNGFANKADITGGDYTAGIVGNTGNMGSPDKPIVLDSVSHTGKVSGGAYVGSIIGYGDYAVVSGVNNTTEVSGSYFVGGIAGLARKCVSCTNTATVTANGLAEDARVGLGGIAGLLDMAEGCENSGAVVAVGGTHVGGIAGGNASRYSDCSFENCENTGTVTLSGNASYVGGIIGGVNMGRNELSLTVAGCKNSGVITVAKGEGVGGILGYYLGAGWNYGHHKLIITNCASLAEIKAAGCTYVGGIAGGSSGSFYNDFYTQMQNITVQGTVTGASSVGSVLGYCENYSKAKLAADSATFTLSNKQLPLIGQNKCPE